MVWSSSSGRSIGPPADVLVGHELELLEERHEARDHDLAVDAPTASGRGIGKDVEGLERHRPIGVRVVVDVDAMDVRLPLVPLEPIDVVLDRLVDVDGPLVDEDLGGEEVDLAEDPRPVRRGVDDHDVLRRRGPEADLRGREVLRAPVPAPVVGLADVALLAEEREEVVGRGRPEDLARLEGHLEGRAADVGQQDVEVVGIDPGLLGRPVEEELRVMDDVLVDRRGRGHEDPDRGFQAPPGPPQLLPGGGDGARVAGQDGDIERADVHAELQGVRGDDAEDLAVAQATLDGPPLRRQVAAPVASDPRSWPEVLAKRLPEPRQEDLDRGPGPSEDDRLAARPDERQGPALGMAEGRRPRPRGLVHQGRVDEERHGARRGVRHCDRRGAPAGRSAGRPAPPGSRWSPRRTR